MSAESRHHAATAHPLGVSFSFARDHLALWRVATRVAKPQAVLSLAVSRWVRASKALIDPTAPDKTITGESVSMVLPTLY